MPWYLVDITRRCEHSGCSRLATHQLTNPANAPSGTFCGRHAPMALADAQRGGPM